MMITSGASQYLHPDYLQPLPTTLDAKKSPLALLAQTCSSIGKDSNPGKSIIPPLEKKDDQKKKDVQSNRKTDSPQRTSSPSEDRAGRDSVKRDSGSPRDQEKRTKDLPALVPISSSSSSSSNGEKGTPPPSDKDSTKGPERDSSSAPATSQTNSAQNSSSNSRISLSCGNMLLEVNHHETNSTSSNSSVSSASAAKTTTTSATSTTPAIPKPGEYPPHPSLHGHYGASYPGCALPLLGHHIPVDTATATPIHPAAISVHSSMGALSVASQKGLPSAHGLSPYTYARVKSASGATTLVPICRDPYCTNCQLTMQNAQFASTCAAGCTQCNHEKTLPTSLASSFGSALGTVPVLPLGASALNPSASALASSYYSHAFSMLPGHHTLPYVCNWMAGSDYCGKRFSTSEELLQHLRTHTSSTDSAALASLYPGLGLSAAAAHASLAACHTVPPHYPPGSISPNSLRQAYPRSLSPNSLLAAARYHPYKSPLSLPTTLSSAVGLPSAALPAGLAPYYSSYALYGQRLGAAAP